MLNTDSPIDQNTTETDAIFEKTENISSTTDHLVEIQPNKPKSFEKQKKSKSCEVCSKPFAQKIHLTIHMRYHKN